MLAVALPVAAWAWVDYRTGVLRDRVQFVAKTPAHIGSIDADLTGCIRLSRVGLGSQFTASALEASVALPSLFAGELSAGEIRVARPRIFVHVDGNGDSDLAVLIQRFARTTGDQTTSVRKRGVRRISAHSGSLIARVDGFGEVSAKDLQLIPDARGVRLITGAVHLRGGTGEFTGEISLARGAAEIALPHVALERLLAVAGSGAIVVRRPLFGNTGATGAVIAASAVRSPIDRHPHSPVAGIEVRDVAVGRMAPGKPFEIHATLDDGGTRRAISATLDHQRTLTVWGNHIPLRSLGPLAPRGLSLTDAHASGTLVAISTTAGAEGRAVRLRIEGQLEGARVDHAAMGPVPIPVSGAVRGSLIWAQDRVVVDQVALDVGESHWSASGWWRRSPPLAAQLEVSLAEAPCGELFASIPMEIRGAVDGLAMTGSLGGRARLAIDLGAPVGDGVAIATEIANHCTVTAEATVADPRLLATQSDHTFPDGTRARVGRGTPTWTELQRVPSHVTAAFVSAEDGRYYDHQGFDLVQIARSLEIDLRDRQLTRGGSTISQQLVKNSFLSHRRSIDRKIQEAILTWRVEDRLSKKQILERYLNVIELGPHVFGIHTAARYWFGIAAHELGVRQAAFLAALTSEPRTMSRRIRGASGLDPESAARVDVILAAMFRDGAIDRATLDLARKLPLRFAPTALREP
jgi:hypothetical protein